MTVQRIVRAALTDERGDKSPEFERQKILGKMFLGMFGFVLTAPFACRCQLYPSLAQAAGFGYNIFEKTLFFADENEGFIRLFDKRQEVKTVG